MTGAEDSRERLLNVTMGLITGAIRNVDKKQYLFLSGMREELTGFLYLAVI